MGSVIPSFGGVRSRQRMGGGSSCAIGGGAVQQLSCHRQQRKGGSAATPPAPRYDSWDFLLAKMCRMPSLSSVCLACSSSKARMCRLGDAESG
jgi:hypothetical protein